MPPESPTLDYLIERAEQGIRHEATLAQLSELHQPIDRDGPTPQACRSCVVGYDPRTGDLTFAAWPCTTAAIIEAGRR